VDVLSDVIAVMRTGQPRSALARWPGRFGQRFAAGAGSAGFRVVLEGSCWLIPASGPPVALGVGVVVFLPHGAEHALADSPTTPLEAHACDQASEQRLGSPPGSDDRPGGTLTLCGAYQLDPVRAHPLLLDLPEVVHLPARLGRHAELRAAVDLLGTELQRPRLGADALVSALLDLLLLYILRSWFDEQPASEAATGWTAALRDPAVGAALHAIHRDPARPWTVGSLGVHVGLSRAAFARRFTTLVGQPPLAYLTWWRMTSAARLLVDSDAPLGAVATRVGYASEFAFATAFKRQLGAPPGTYRKRHRPAR
jgi:AraC-like DNA-binding protein